MSAELDNTIAALAARLEGIDARLDAGDQRMGRIETAQAENNTMTAEIRDLITATKAGFKVLGQIGAVARWVGWIAGAATAVLGFLHLLKTGHPPPKP